MDIEEFGKMGGGEGKEGPFLVEVVGLFFDEVRAEGEEELAPFLDGAEEPFGRGGEGAEGLFLGRGEIGEREVFGAEAEGGKGVFNGFNDPLLVDFLEAKVGIDGLSGRGGEGGGGTEAEAGEFLDGGREVGVGGFEFLFDGAEASLE